jgi:ubiquinone/menaquinone biosynthesis C-methylase UbiE
MRRLANSFAKKDTMKQYLIGRWDQQYRCPSGTIGWLAGAQMVRQHRPETTWTLDLLDIQPTDQVLDVGFGAGQGIKLASKKATLGRVMGVDLSSAMVRVARRRNAREVRAGRVVLAQGSITALPFPDQQFDKIMTIHTWYFWPEPSRALDELQRVLKPGGRLVMTLCTGIINARGEVEMWPLHSALEEQVMPQMRQGDFQVVRMLQGPNSRRYTSVAIMGEK